MGKKDGGKAQGGHNCGSCGGSGRVSKQAQRADKNGKTRTETVTVDCKACRGSGWVDR